MRTLNFNNRQTISKEELKIWDESLRELVGNVLKYGKDHALSGCVLDCFASESAILVNDFFKVELGTTQISGFNTIKIGTGIGLLDVSQTSSEFISGLTTANDALKKQLITLFKWAAKDNIPIPGIGSYSEDAELYVGFIPIWNPLEAGLCSLSNSNQVTISGGNFDSLRGSITKNPTKVRFYKQDGTPANNSDTYEVITVSSNSMVISGVLTSESDVKLLVVGSYDLAVQGSLTDKYCYPTASGVLTFNTDLEAITENGGFLIASLIMADDNTFGIVDQRSQNLFGQITDAHDIMFLSRVQTVTGAKTFTTHSPVFKIKTNEFLDPLSYATALSIGHMDDVDPTKRGLLTIPSGCAGKMIRVKAVDVRNDDTLSKIDFENGYVAGDHFYLYIDHSSLPILSVSNNGAKYVRVNDYLTSINYLRPGSILDIIADENLGWVIVNTSMIAPTVENNWTPLNLLNGWEVSTNSLHPALSYRIDPSGYAEIRGWLEPKVARDRIFADIPASITPNYDIVAVVFDDDVNPPTLMRILIDTTLNQIKFMEYFSTTPNYFINLRYPLIIG